MMVDSEEYERFESAASLSTHLTSETRATSFMMDPLQIIGPSYDTSDFDPIGEDEIDSYDLLDPPGEFEEEYSLESRSNQMFSRRHLEIMFEKSSLLLRFTAFLSTHRPGSLPMLIYFLDALKALRAIAYANAITMSLDNVDGYEFTKAATPPICNMDLESKASAAFDILVENDLPAYITHLYVKNASFYVSKRISGSLPQHLQETSEGLAEVFCLTDPARKDNPIVFASEEFHRTTQYGLSYSIGRNCRFLQGPSTNPHSSRRLRQAVEEGKEHSEVFLNYRRDGSPFMNLLMIAPLMDAKGQLRYFIGAQVDVSGLVKNCSGLEGLQQLDNEARQKAEDIKSSRKNKDEFQALSEMLNMSELETVQLHGGSMHRESPAKTEGNSQHPGTRASHRPRLVLKEPSNDDKYASVPTIGNIGCLSGVYTHYLLLRPFPSLRVLFASPTLRIPGMLQSKFMDRIRGSPVVLDGLTSALAEGRGVTARIRWTSRFDEEGRPRYVHCTPLIGANRRVGVWMVVLVDVPHKSELSENPKAVERLQRHHDTNGKESKSNFDLEDFSLGEGKSSSPYSAQVL